MKLVPIKAGDIFSRQKIIDAQMQIGLFLSEYGYGMPNMLVKEPKIDEKYDYLKQFKTYR